MTDTVVARPWMRCQGHVAHGTLEVGYITRYRSPRDLRSLGPAALGV